MHAEKLWLDMELVRLNSGIQSMENGWHGESWLRESIIRCRMMEVFHSTLGVIEWTPCH